MHQLSPVAWVLRGRGCYHPQVWLWKARTGWHKSSSWFHWLFISIAPDRSEGEPQRGSQQVQCHPAPKCEAKVEAQAKGSPSSFCDIPSSTAWLLRGGEQTGQDGGRWGHRDQGRKSRVWKLHGHSPGTRMIRRKARPLEWEKLWRQPSWNWLNRGSTRRRGWIRLKTNKQAEGWWKNWCQLQSLGQSTSSTESMKGAWQHGGAPEGRSLRLLLLWGRCSSRSQRPETTALATLHCAYLLTCVSLLPNSAIFRKRYWMQRRSTCHRDLLTVHTPPGSVEQFMEPAKLLSFVAAISEVRRRCRWLESLTQIRPITRQRKSQRCSPVLQLKAQGSSKHWALDPPPLWIPDRSRHVGQNLRPVYWSKHPDSSILISTLTVPIPVLIKLGQVISNTINLTHF